MFGLVRMWLRLALAAGILTGAGAMLWHWSERLPDPRPPRPESERRIGDELPPQPPPTFGERLAVWSPGFDRVTAMLVGGLLLSAVSLGGGRAFWWLRLRGRGAADDPRHDRSPESKRLARPGGAELHVEFLGPPDAPPIVLTHGWGACATEWYYLKRQLAGRYRLIMWDLPGLGLSTSPADKNFSLDRLAADLGAVLAEAGGRPAILLGHSIGGMITQNYCKLFPAEAARLAGLVLVHTSHTNPLTMTKLRAVAAPLQKPVVEPLAHLMIAFAPLVWLSNVLSYLNGSLHRSNHKQLFAGTETWGQLEFVSRFVPYVWPATYARGMLGMFHWDASDNLPRIPVPTLVVAGAEDQITLAEASEIIARDCPQARLVTLKPAGHMGLVERHEEFGRLVEAFAGERFAGRAGG